MASGMDKYNSYVNKQKKSSESAAMSRYNAFVDNYDSYLVQKQEQRAAQQQIAEQDRQRRQQNIDRGIEEFQAAQANGQLPPPRPGTRTAAELNYTGANPATAINPTVHVGMVSRNAEVRPEANVEWDHNEINRDVLYRKDTAPMPVVGGPLENVSLGRTPAFNFEDFAESLENDPQISREDADLIRYQYDPVGFGERESTRTPQNVFEKYNIYRNNEEYRERYEYSQAVSKYESLSDEDKEYIDIIMKANDDNKSADWEYISSYFSGSGTGSRRNTTSSLAAIEEAKEHLRSKGYTDREIQLMVHYHTANRNKEYSEYWQGEFENFAREHPFAAGATSVAMSLATPMGAIEYVESEINDTPVDLNSVYWSPTIIKDTIRTEQSENIEENYGRGWSKVYEHGMSGADMVLTNLVTPRLGLTSTGNFLKRLPTNIANNIVGGSFLGAQAATSAMRDVSMRGGTNEQAFAMGSAVFIIEALSEAASIGELGEVTSSGKRGIFKWVKDVLWEAGVNLEEEGVAQIAEIVADNVIMGENSRYNLLIKKLMSTKKEDGTYYTRSEAEQLAKEAMAWEVVEAALGGAALGGALGGIGGAYGQGRQYVWDAALGYDIKQSGMASDVVAVARNSTDPNVTQWVNAINKTDKTTGQTNVRNDVLGGTYRALTYSNTQQVVEADNMFADIDNLDDLEVAYRNKIGVKNKISPIAKKITGDYKFAKSVIKDGGIIRRPEKAESQTATQSRSSLEVRTETAENAQPTQSTQPAEVKAFTPEQKVQTTNPTVGRTAEGKVVSVSDITDIKNGQIFVKTSDGKTQALKYADIGNAQARKVWEMAAKSFTDPKAAKAFIDNYNGEMVSDYAKTFNDYYQLASAGMSLEQINEAGVAKGNISLAAKVAAVDAGAMSISYRKGVVDQTTTKKTKMQSLQMQMLDSFGKKYGLNITFVNTLGDFNGFYKPGTNQIVVGLDASEGAVTRTVGHEVYHYIKDANKEGAQKIEDFVLKSLKKLKGEEWVQNKLDSYDKSVYKTEQERIDELVADSMFDVFTNEKTVQEFVKQDRSLAQRVLDRVKTLIADIRNIYNKLIAKGYDEIAALRNELETLEKIRDLFFEALDETAPAVNQEQKNTAKAVKYSASISKGNTVEKITRNMSDDESARILKSKTMNNIAKQNQLDIINKTNPAPNTYNTWIRTVDDIKTLAETLEDNDWDYEEFNPDLTRTDIRNAIQNGKITVYSSYPIKNGVFVSPSKMEAESYSGNGKVFEKTVDINDVAWIDPTQGQYAKVDGVRALNSFPEVKFSKKHWHPNMSGTELEYVSRVAKNELFNKVNGTNYDGVITPTETVVYEPTQIKSATDNIGTFDRSNPDIRYSTKPTNPIREEVSDYIGSSAHVQSVIKTIDKRYRLAGKKKLNEKSIERFANKILSQTNSKYNKEQLIERLTALFEFMANSRDFSWDDIMQITAEISKDVLSQSSKLDTSMRDEFSDTLKWLKGIDKVYISPEVRAEIDATFGSLDSFRRQIGSRMKITVTDSSAISLDSVWSQLAGDYPGVFDSEITPLDQPAALADFFEMTKPTYKNPYEMNMDEAAYDYTLRIYDQYFDIPEVKTEAQKHQIAMQRAREDFNKRLDTMRKEYKAREQEIVREAKLQADNRIAREQLLNKRRQEAYREKRFETELVQKYRAQILRKLNGITKKLVRPTDSEHIPQELIKSINDFAKTLVGSGAFTSQKADNLKRAFDAIGEAAQNPNFNLASMYDEDIAVKLDNLKSILEGRRFSDLSSAELKKVREITDYFAHIIKMSNEAFSESIKERISDLQSDAMDSARDVGSNRKRMGTAFQTGLLKPVTFFELLDNPTLEKLYTVIRNGEGDWYRVVNKSKEFLQKIKKEYNFKNWKKDTVEIELERGGNLALTVGEAMSVYATARRKQGIDHLMKGGIVKDSDAAKKTKKLKKDKVNIKGENISLTIKDIQQISSALTEEQKGFANKMIEYLSNDMAELGNERTMRIYGIRKFNESNYFPIRSASNFLYTKPGVQDDARIKHMSMTKKTTPHANNPVIIGDFTEVAMNHCNDMALYYGFVLALEDFTRVYNYKTMDSDGTSQTSVKQQLERAFGKKANSYIMQMLTDINGGVKAQAGTNVINKMMSKAKKDAVFASLSVAVQQPSAIARTMLYLNPKYLAKTTFSKRSWNELKEYAPVAGVKDMGYFDANIGRQAVDWMLDEKYEGLKEKAFALFKDGNYRDDLLSFLPAYMDRITWGHIWEAVKAETKDKTDLEVGSKEFLEAAGERFTYIIDRTQVYDSVFSRSEWMRSKDTGMKTVMAFMAEPVTNLNMLYNAAVKARHGDVGFLAKALSAYAISVALNSALKALVTAGRDDDDDESFAEKYLAAFISGVVEEPFGMIPYLKDAISLIKGYDSKRMDTQVIANFVDSIKTIFNGDKSDYEKLKAVASAVGMVIGLPVKNIWRDIEMIYNGVTDIVNGVKEPTTKKGITYTLLKEFDSKRFKLLDIPNTAEQYVEAYFLGDEEHMEKTYNNLMEKYADEDMEQHEIEDKVRSAIKEAITNGYKEGQYTQDQVMEFYVDIIVPSYGDDKKRADADMVKALKDYDPRVLEAAQAQIDGDSETRIRLTKEIIADGFDQNLVVKAVNSMINKLSEEPEEEYELKEQSLYSEEDYFDAASRGNESEANTYKEELIRVDMENNGKTRVEAEKSFNSNFRSMVKDAVVAGDITVDKAAEMLEDFGGLDEETAQMNARYYDFIGDYPDLEYNWKVETFADYYEFAKPSGIRAPVYDDYLVRKSECEGTDNNNDGKADNGSKKAQILDVIDSLPISSRQKDVLYRMNGWAESKLYEAPWH